MGIRDHLFLNLLPTLRSWLFFSMSTSCYDCRCSLPGAGYAHRCRSCGRSFCKKCMQVQQVGPELPVFCKFCFQAIVGRAESLETLQVPRNSRLAHLQDFSNFSSPRSSRSDEEEDGDDSAKRFFSAASELSQDASDVDSVNISTGLQFSSFKSVNSSPMDSPSRGGEVAGDNNNGPLDPGYFKKTGAESEDLLDGSHYDNLSVYRNHEEAEKVQQPLDFENNWLIWDPPLPEDENDDRETGFFEFDDEDDDIGDSSKVFSSGSFSIHSLSLREKPSDLHKEQLRSAVHGHFRALVCQLLKGEGLQNGGDVWLDVVSSLAWQAAIFVKPDTGKGSSMDPGNYVKVKCILSGKPSDSVLVKGVVCTKNVKHKRMVSQHKNPRLFLLGGALEYQRVSSKLASINTVLEQETDHLKVSISKIEAHRPNVLLVEKSASPSAQEYLLTKEISLVLNVKRSLMERIARCSGAHIASSIDNIVSARLGHCEMFRVEKFYEECPSGSHPNKKFMKTLMFFEGCPRRLGCTVLLRGTHPEELKKVKHVVQYASFAAYHLSRETSFLADEGATLPKISPSRPSVISEKVDADSSFSVPLTANSIVHDAREVVAGGQQNLCSYIDDATKCCFPSEDVPLQGDVNSEIPAYSHLAEDIAAGPSEPSEPSDIPVSSRIPAEAMDTLLEERRNLAFQDEHGSVNEGIRTSMEENEAADYYSADSQSILVSLSTACVLKGTICEPSQLIRIKFYGSFDKPLGRYLRDDLFDQTTYCHTCKELAEAHVRCYTHQHGSLTISVRRHPSMTLPGEHEGRIWMWHRCLKCEQNDGVPPAARRVVMSDAAWGLSFGKFLELSFSNHATANRVASCGHSLQKDCLRFYGCGRMLAFFRYSPVDILSVHLPPLVLDFTCKVQQEWAEREAADFTSRIEFLHMEVTSVLQRFEQNFANSEYEPVKTSIQKYITELKDLLKKERYEYDILLRASTAYDNILFQGTIDILELNRLRRCLLLDSHTWDRRLCLLDSFSKSNSASNLHPQVSEFATYTNPKDWLVESLSTDDKYINYLDETVIKPTTLSKHHEELNLHTLECNINNMVEMDFSIDSVGLNLFSGHFDRGISEVRSVTEANTSSSSLGRLPSAASALSDQIDSLWSGNPDVDGVGSLSPMHNRLYRKVLSPMRVKSFDSALRFRDKMRGRSASLHLTSVRSFDASGDSGNDYMQSPKFVKKSNCVPNHNPVFISSSSHMVGEGARLLLPQSSHDDLVIILYENEPSTIISYAISSQDHTDFITSDHQHNDEPSGRLMVSQFQSDEESQRSKGPHFKISFDDESSIPADKVKFSVTCYFAKQFCTLRKKCCPDEADFLRSLSRCKRWKAQGGKSNVYFAKSFDDRFIIKQVTKTELESFEVFAPEYFNYMTQSINTGSPTCLAKVLGIYQVTVRHLKGGREVKMDLMVMENLFFGRTLSKVYDLKGSSRARYNPDTSGNDKVLLDMNLLESLRTKPIFLGSKAKRRLERAVWNDTSFLASVDVMDYSLLVGIDDERKELVIGIIDFMRQYTWDKHLETWVKASGILGGPKNSSPTVVSPLQYKKRFRKAMSKYFLTVPDQWSPS